MEPLTLVLEPTPCPGCDGSAARPVYEARDEIYGVDPRAFPLVQCSQCALVYLGVRPTRETIAAAYPPAYLWRQAFTEPGPDADWNRLLGAFYFRQLYGRRANEALAVLPPGPARVLDLGAGGGHFLAALAARRAGDYVGVDFEVGTHPPAGVQVRAADLNELEFDGPSFDLVTFWHVLEHLHAPRQALAAAFQALKPGGSLILGTQNFDAFSRQLMGPHWPLNDIPRHLCHFTPATLTALVTAAGFEAVEVRLWNEYFPALGGHLFPRAVARADGSLHAAPGLALSLLFAPLEAALTFAGRGCTFSLHARRPAAPRATVGLVE